MVVQRVAQRTGKALADEIRRRAKRKKVDNNVPANARTLQSTAALQSIPTQTTLEQDNEALLKNVEGGQIKRTVNSDGSQTVSIGDRTFKLTKDEARIFENTSGNANVPGRKELLDAIAAKNALRSDITKLGETQGALRGERIERAVLEREAKRQGIPEVNLPQIQALIDQDKANRNLANQTDQAIPRFTGENPELGTQIITEELLSAKKKLRSGVGAQSVALGIIANVAEIGRSGITGGQPVKAKKAEEALDDALQRLEEQVEFVGQSGDPVTASKVSGDIQTAVERLNDLETSLQGLSRINSEYFVREGLDAQLIVQTKKRELEIIRQELEFELQEGRIRRARERFGG